MKKKRTSEIPDIFKDVPGETAWNRSIKRVLAEKFKKGLRRSMEI
jgi:hypothetical protein